MDKDQLLGQLQQAFIMGRQERYLIAQEHEAVQNAVVNATLQTAESRYAEVLAAIPMVVKTCAAEGLHFGRIMRLRYDESTEHPAYNDSYWNSNRATDPKILKDAAAMVFVYCVEAGLRPYLVRDSDKTIQKNFLYIGIRWDHL